MSQTLEQLREGHRHLRAQLNLLEAALRMGEAAWFVIREFCVSLSRQLGEHIQQEQAAARELGFPSLACDHGEVHQSMRIIQRHLIVESPRALDTIRSAFEAVIDALRNEMAHQESALFPLLAHLDRTGILEEEEAERTSWYPGMEPEELVGQLMKTTRRVQGNGHAH